MQKANSYNEWGQLQHVVVGRGEGYLKHHVDESFVLFFLENIFPLLSAGEKDVVGKDKYLPPEYMEISKRVLDELIEDIELLCDALKKESVKVLRPDILTCFGDSVIQTPDWESVPTPALNVRDLTIVLGNTIVETSSHVRARLFENDALRAIFYDYFKAGSNWVSMPKPRINDGSLDPSFYDNHYLGTEYKKFICEAAPERDTEEKKFEIIFDGAQCMRLGEDIIVNVANQNHELAFQWLERQFSNEFHFHKIEKMADNHIDSVVLPLRPGLLLLRSEKYPKLLPEKLQKWDVVYFPEPNSASTPPNLPSETIPLASPYIDMNILSINEETVVVNSLYPELIRELEALSFTVIPVRHRHGRLFSGGFHCFTLDTVRQGGREKYL